jgi:tRNA threonylcarbamoyl adenosine modification protein YeaZ
MWTLAFEFSSDVRSVAVVRGGAKPVVAGRAVVKDVRRTPGLALVQAAMQEASVDRGQITRLAIGLGPGSYTGIRIALALAQGWQLASGASSVGLCSAEVMIEQVWRLGRRGKVHVVVDAQRGDLYHGVYGLVETGWETVTGLKIEPASALSADGADWISPEAVPSLDWAEPVFPDAGILGCMAVNHPSPVPAAMLEPVYLRETAFLKAPPVRLIPGITIP